MNKAANELTLYARLHKAGMTLEKQGNAWRVLAGNQVLLERGPNGGPLALSDIDNLTKRFDA